MNPPSIFLDHSFLVAVENAGDEHHVEAVSKYGEMIEDFVAQRFLLVARADHPAAEYGCGRVVSYPSGSS